MADNWIMGRIGPKMIRIDASTACQLRCPSCPTTTGRIGATLGTRFLRVEDFKKLVDDNPSVRAVELSNWGEIFLNPGLPEIVEYAHSKGVALYAENGVNLNTASDEVLEALVKYRFRSMTCSIDGASSETYALYRRRGDFERVIQNVRRLNELKARHRSKFPVLLWQFVVFGHNEHEIARARVLAKELNMGFFVKLSWGAMFEQEAFSPVNDREAVQRATRAGVADRREYSDTYGEDYRQRRTCGQLWRSPQLNWDGRVLGCCVNYWGDFGHAFADGLVESVNSEKMKYARQMLTGRKPERDDIPCTTCVHYLAMKRRGGWLTRKDAALPPLLEGARLWVKRGWPELFWRLQG